MFPYELQHCKISKYFFHAHIHKLHVQTTQGFELNLLIILWEFQSDFALIQIEFKHTII